MGGGVCGGVGLGWGGAVTQEGDEGGMRGVKRCAAWAGALRACVARRAAGTPLRPLRRVVPRALHALPPLVPAPAPLPAPLPRGCGGRGSLAHAVVGGGLAARAPAARARARISERSLPSFLLSFPGPSHLARSAPRPGPHAGRGRRRTRRVHREPPTERGIAETGERVEATARKPRTLQTTHRRGTRRKSTPPVWRFYEAGAGD